MDQQPFGTPGGGQPLVAPPPDHRGAPNQSFALRPEFFMKSVPLYDAQGQFVEMREVEYVRVNIAGDMKSVPERKVTDHHRYREWPEEYQAFKRGQAHAVRGTPITQWQVLKHRQELVRLLEMHHVYTIEGLAEVPDTALPHIGMEARTLRQEARAYVEARRLEEPVNRLEQENKDLRARLGEMEEAIRRMEAAEGAPTLPHDEVRSQTGPLPLPVRDTGDPPPPPPAVEPARQPRQPKPAKAKTEE